MSRGRPKTHGMTKTRTYETWHLMIKRCHNKKGSIYKNYNGRGICVCDRWRKFENFVNDMGIRPEGRSLDRINNNGNYEPINCRWATPQEQANNSRRNKYLVAFGKKMTIAQWAREVGLSPSAINGRIKNKWPKDKALTHPVECSNIKTVHH